MGKILSINLTERSSLVLPLTEEIARKYIGGTGLGAFLLTEYVREYGYIPEALDPASPLIFATGPLTGTKTPSSSRYAVIARSPLTGIWGESDSGGAWGLNLKRAGYDAVILTGRSSAPVYLLVTDQEVSFHSAEPLWGLDTYKTIELLEQVIHKDSSSICIGPAGEKLLPMASIMSEGTDARAAGRCGLGAVMGSKNLKAIVASGNLNIPVVDPSSLQKQIKDVAATVVKKTDRYKQFGTAGGLVGNAVIGDSTAKNWTIGNWAEEAEQISGQKMAKDFSVGRYYCPTCIIGCGRKVKSTQGLSKDSVVAGPEYETLAGFGVQLMVKNLASIIESNDLCNRFGLDTISVSGSIAFLLEAAEKGNLPKKYFAGLDLSWGNETLASNLIHQIIDQTDLGQLLSKGVRGIMYELGEETKPFAIHGKGLEPSFHDPRALSSLAVGYATYPRGACHRGCSHTIERTPIPELGYHEALDRFQQEGKGKMAAVMQDYAELYNCLKLCQFLLPSLSPSIITGWLNSVVGWDMDSKELLEVGERNINLKRLYNFQCGIRREDDTLPERFLKEKFTDGGAKNFLPNLDLMLEEYYQARCWNSDGFPTHSKLIELGLES